jgi:hypothetical protein
MDKYALLLGYWSATIIALLVILIDGNEANLRLTRSVLTTWKNSKKRTSDGLDFVVFAVQNYADCQNGNA